MFAVEFSVSEVAAGSERLLTHGALQTLFVPRGLVDAHQEAVGYGPLATLTHRLLMTLRACTQNTSRNITFKKIFFLNQIINASITEKARTFRSEGRR